MRRLRFPLFIVGGFALWMATGAQHPMAIVAVVFIALITS